MRGGVAFGLILMTSDLVVKDTVPPGLTRRMVTPVHINKFRHNLPGVRHAYPISERYFPPMGEKKKTDSGKLPVDSSRTYFIPFPFAN